MQGKLVKIEDLYLDKNCAQKHNNLNALLNAEPKEEWIKRHPIASNRYIPIERIEYLLTTIFLKWRVEIKETQLIANSVVVTVRLYVLDPTTNEWNFNDGIGAMPVQTDKGAGATDFTKVKSDAVMKAAPAAESYAIKDAAEKFGKIFGKDINRRDEIVYSYLSHRDIDGQSNYQNEINSISTIEDLMEYAQKNRGRGAEFDKYILKRKAEIENS